MGKVHLPARTSRPAVGLLLVLLAGVTVLLLCQMQRPATLLGGTQALQLVMEARVCGSPAHDAYATVDEACLLRSPAAAWWRAVHEAAGQEALAAALVVHIERRADYDGMAVHWGIGFTQPSVLDCARACQAHMPNLDSGHMDALPCNSFTWCGAAGGCWEPDAHQHSYGDCWLKFTEGPAAPEVNMRGAPSRDQRARHPDAPAGVQWHAGVLLPHGVQLRNGTWGPRHAW